MKQKQVKRNKILMFYVKTADDTAVIPNINLCAITVIHN